MKTTFLLMFFYITFVANCIATEMNDNDLYSFTFLLSPIINELPQTKDINPDKGDWKFFSFQVADLDFDKNVHARYDNAMSIKIKEYDNVVFNVSELETIDDVGIDVMKENSKLAKAYHGRTLLCGLHDLQMKKQLKQKQIFRYMDETSDELTALSIIHV